MIMLKQRGQIKFIKLGMKHASPAESNLPNWNKSSLLNWNELNLPNWIEWNLLDWADQV